MTPLSPAFQNVLRLRGVFAALIILVAAGVAERVMLDKSLPVGGFLVGAVLIGSYLSFFSPGRRYRAWAYDVTADELLIQSGIWLRSRTVVPFGRVQHIDVAQGPIERRYRLGTLILHTAGTRSAAVSLPGLLMSEAERMRDDIRAQIRQDLV